jgi:hypothetical protein
MALVLPIKWSLFFAGDVIGLALPTNLLVMDGIKPGGERGFCFSFYETHPFPILSFFGRLIFLAEVYFFLSSLFLLSLLVNHGASSFFCILCLVPFGSLLLFLLFLSTYPNLRFCQVWGGVSITVDTLSTLGTQLSLSSYRYHEYDGILTDLVSGS